MNTIEIHENGLYVYFTIHDSGIVELLHFTSESNTNLKTPLQTKPHSILEVQETGKSSQDQKGNKNILCSASNEFLYQFHTFHSNEKGKVLEIHLKTDEDVNAIYHMQFFDNIPVVQVWSTLINDGNLEHPLESVSSFVYHNLCGEGKLFYEDKTNFYIPHNSWCCEARWQKVNCNDINLTGMVHGYNMPNVSRKVYRYGAKSSWSSVEYIPMGMTEDTETQEVSIYQVEHSGQWSIEVGTDYDRRLYIAMNGASQVEHGWYYNLKPGSTFETVPISYGVVQGSVDDAIAAMSQYRRVIAKQSKESYIVFNDYMNCLMGDPHEENEKQIIDIAAKLGCEYYCMDAGWYDSGFWWDKVGEWKESKERFPNGLKTLFDYAHVKGLKMGLWLEIEVMGIASPLANSLPDHWFVCRNGKRHIDHGRYLLDFRNKEVRNYCSSVIDRIVNEYGCDYFKIDYNVTMGIGSDLNTDSPSQMIRDHYEALYSWYQDIFKKYPDLVIENCGSGGMRMDYGMLKLLHLQSTSDQTDYIWNSFIGTSVASAVLPEQAGMWVYPYKNEREHVIYNFVNGLLLRPYLSGLVWNMSEENLSLMKEGVSLYKEIRNDIKISTPFFPLGFNHTNIDQVLTYGLQNNTCAYLSVLTPFTDEARIPLCFKNKIQSVSVIYPESIDCEYELKDDTLIVKMPQKAAGRLFKITF